MNNDNKKRSLSKGISYRVCGTLVTMIIVFMLTGSLPTTGIVGLAEFFGKIILYYIHERMWVGIKWGKNKNVTQ